MLWQPLSKIGRSLKVFQEKNRARPPGRTLQKSTHDSDMYNRAFPIGNALFFFAGGVMSLLYLPCGKLAFAQRSGAMKAPVGLSSDRTVLRKQDGGASPRQVTAGLPRCSSRQGWPGRMPVPDVRWLHRDKGIGIIRHLGEILHQEINILLDSPDSDFQRGVVDSRVV